MRIFLVVMFSVFIAGCGPFSAEAKGTDVLMIDMRTAIESVEKCNSVGFTPYVRIRETTTQPTEFIFSVSCYEKK